MIKRFSRKLRVAGLEDRLQNEMQLLPASSKWLVQMGCDIAQQRGIDLMALKGRVQLNLLFNMLSEDGHDGLLKSLAAQQPEFGEHLAQLMDVSSGTETRAA